ncbi:MAG: DUF86 domain-containing protein [Nanoarchaeota archaeon]|mgnify:CR=1 FL=1
MSSKEDVIFIEHIFESITALEEFSKDLNKERLMSDRLRQSAMIREIEVIGEAMKNISEKLKNKYTEIAWKKIIGTRDKMIHHYFGVDLHIVWNIVKKDIPILKKQMKKIKKDFAENKFDSLIHSEG